MTSTDSLDYVLRTLGDEIVRGTGDLPVLPKAAAEALRLANSKDMDFERVAKVAESDPPLAARFLGVANSALYYRGTTVRSLHRAVVRLGAQTTRDVLYMAVYGSTVFDVPEFRDLVEDSFTHSIQVAHIAREVAPLLGSDPDRSFLAGLLHEMGRARCYKIAARNPNLRADRAVVQAAVDQLYPEAGARLAQAWHLPDEVVECCRRHLDPGDHTLSTVIHSSIPVARYAEASRTFLEVPGSPAPDNTDAIARLASAGVGEDDAESVLQRGIAVCMSLSGLLTAI